MTKKTGVIHGRFQPLHLGHMEYLMEGKKRCEFLFIGISIPDPRYGPDLAYDHRATEVSNPFTYFERLIMIRKALLESGVKQDEFEMVPFPVDQLEYLKYYVPFDAVFFVTIYDNWGWKKADMFKDMGLDVEIMWERSMEDRFTSGSEIRERIAFKKPWKHLVPPQVYEYIRKKSLERRVAELFGKF